MKIKNIKIKNFKSIKDIEINCNKGINAFIGKNGTGKSALFEAVTFVLGENWPSINSFNKEWYVKNEEKNCLIEVNFTDNTIIKFDTSLGAFNFSITNIAKGYKSNDETRAKYKINYLGSDRNIKGIMPTNSYSLLGKYFYNTDLFKDVKEEFELKMKEANEVLKKSNKYNDFVGSINEYFGEQIGRNKGIDKIETKSELYDTRHFLKTLEFYTGDEINLSNQGSGIQNSFIIACLRALAKHNNNENNPIFIDEPELYLHPHAKKALYHTLQELTDKGTQIFYITHSSEFLSYHKSEEICRFYIDRENGTKCTIGKNEMGTGNNIDINNNKISYNEAFFADIVFIVEGYSDYLFLKYVIETKTGKGIEVLNISILNAMRKSNMKTLYDTYCNLNINTFVLFDKDNKQNDVENASLEALNSYGFDNNIEEFLGYTINKDDNKPDKIIEWIKSSKSDSKKQAKVDEFWEILIGKMPELNSLTYLVANSNC